MDTFFEDLVVVELANVLAGPSVGMFFAELGATVIKVENPSTGGDITRKWKLPSEPSDGDSSVYYSCINYGKTSVFIDVTTIEGRSEVIRYVKQADVVISNFKASFRLKHNYTYQDFKHIKDDIIYAELNAYPDQERPAFDILLQAETGFLAMTGVDDHLLAKIPVALIDVIAGHQLKQGVLMGMIRKAKEGVGSYVKTSLYQSAIASLINQSANYLQSSHIAKPNGTIHSNIAPYGDLFQDKDQKYFVLAVGTERQFLGLLRAINLDQKDEWSTNQRRLVNRDNLKNDLQDIFQNMKQNEIRDTFTIHQVPFAYICSLNEVLDSPQSKVMILNGQVTKTVAFEVI